MYVFYLIASITTLGLYKSLYMMVISVVQRPDCRQVDFSPFLLHRSPKVVFIGRERLPLPNGIINKVPDLVLSWCNIHTHGQRVMEWTKEYTRKHVSHSHPGSSMDDNWCRVCRALPVKHVKRRVSTAFETRIHTLLARPCGGECPLRPPHSPAAYHHSQDDQHAVHQVRPRRRRRRRKGARFCMLR
jgi:hypothetical protein